MTHHRKFAFDVGITFFATSISIFLGFGISILLGRTLGADDLGLYKMASTIFGTGLMIATLGIPATIIKFVSENKDNRKEVDVVVSSGLVISALIGLAFLFTFYFASVVFEEIFRMDGLEHLLKIVSLAFPFALLAGSFLGVLNGLREMKKFAAATILQSVLTLSLSILFVTSGSGVDGVIYAIAISYVGSFAYLTFACRKFYSNTLKEFRQTVARILRFGSRVLGANIVNMINYQGDLILVGFFLTTTDVGYYGVAVGLGKFFWILPQAIQTITYPAISENWKMQNTRMIGSIVDKTTKYAAFILLPTGLALGLLSPQIVKLIFGQGFDGAVLPLQILLIGTLVNGILQRPIGSILFSIGAPGLNLRIFSTVAFVNIILNLLLIPAFGIAGAAVASSFSFIMVTALILFFVRRMIGVTLDWSWFGAVGITTGICVVMCLVLAILNLAMLGLIPISALVLIIWIWLFDTEDRTRLTDLTKAGINRYIVGR